MYGNEMLNFYYILTLISLILGSIGALIAKRKKRSAIGWFIFCGVFLFPIFIIIKLPPNGEESNNKDNAHDTEA